MAQLQLVNIKRVTALALAVVSAPLAADNIHLMVLPSVATPFLMAGVAGTVSLLLILAIGRYSSEPHPGEQISQPAEPQASTAER